MYPMIIGSVFGLVLALSLFRLIWWWLQRAEKRRAQPLEQDWRIPELVRTPVSYSTSPARPLPLPRQHQAPPPPPRRFERKSQPAEDSIPGLGVDYALLEQALPADPETYRDTVPAPPTFMGEFGDAGSPLSTGEGSFGGGGSSGSWDADSGGSDD